MSDDVKHIHGIVPDAVTGEPLAAYPGQDDPAIRFVVGERMNFDLTKTIAEFAEHCLASRRQEGTIFEPMVTPHQRWFGFACEWDGEKVTVKRMNGYLAPSAK
jgi:hypothetical protein